MKRKMDLEGEVYLPSREEFAATHAEIEVLKGSTSPEDWARALHLRRAHRTLMRESANARHRERRIERGAK